MKIIIIGCGKVGHVLTGLLSAEKHDIIVIDPDQEVLDRLTDEFDIIGVKGNGASLTVQNEAEVGKADLMIAVSPEDEINIICCLLAKKLGVKHTIARIRNPEYADSLSFMKEELGLSMVINPERAAAREIMKIINFPSAISIIGLSKKKWS